MTCKRYLPSRHRGHDPKQNLLANPGLLEVIRGHLATWKPTNVLVNLQQSSLLLVCWVLVYLSRKLLTAKRAGLRVASLVTGQRIARSSGVVLGRLGAAALSTSLLLLVCLSSGIVSPQSIRSSSHDQEVSLGALLLPPGQVDTLSDDDGWENPQSADFPEPPPSDFADIPLPKIQDYSFEPSSEFLGGTPQESALFIEKLFGPAGQSHQEPQLPILPTPKESDGLGTEAITKPEPGEPAEEPPDLPEPSSGSEADSSSETTVVSHVVSPGENLWLISRKYGVRSRDIIAYNNLKHPSRLMPGFELLIPGVSVPKHTEFLRFPLEQVQISSGYGERLHPIFRKRMLHRGIDMRAKRGTPVYAAAPGRVIFARRSGGKGKTIAISHKNGIKTVYAHLHTILVKVGDRVAAGQIIGEAGATGRVTAPHLHFEVWKNNRHVDPLTLLPPAPRLRAYTQRQ